MTTEFPRPTYDLQTVLDLACAADRVNGGYVKTIEGVFAIENDVSKVMAYRVPNRELMLFTLGELKIPEKQDPLTRPTLLCTTMEDREQALEIKKFFRRLMFAAIEGEDQFRTDLNSVLNSDSIPSNKFGFIACLPSMYRREYAKVRMEKLISQLDPGFLGEIGAELLDKDCEILDVVRSKNYDAWNIHAIVENRMASWMSKHQPKPGPAVMVKAKIKAHGTHWKYSNEVTRLNYVKVFQ